MTEMLESPLQLLSYLELRARFGERLMVTQETTLLSFHLKGTSNNHNFFVGSIVGAAPMILAHNLS